MSDLLEDRDGAPYPEPVQKVIRALEAPRLGLWEFEIEAARNDVANAIESVIDSLRESGRLLGDEQCCSDVCEGGACETCPGCCAGFCVNGHDFRGDPDTWLSMTDEQRQDWWRVAREHNQGLDAALARAEAAEEKRDRLAAQVEAVRALRDQWKRVGGFLPPSQMARLDRALDEADWTEGGQP